MDATRQMDDQAPVDRARMLPGAAQPARVGLVRKTEGFVLVEVVGAVDIAARHELTDVLGGAADSGAPAVAGVAPAGRAPQPHGYEHLAPLFAQHAALPEGHLRRERLRDELITGYLPVARNIARKYGSRGENPDDLQQVAMVGLVLAVDRFDHERGVDFLSFAVPTITGEVLRHLRDRMTPVRVPRRLRQLQSQIYDAVAELGQRHGHAARPSEIARHLGVDVEVVLEGLAAQGAGRTSSLDEPAGDDPRAGDRTRFDSVLAQVEPEFDLVEHREDLGPLLAALPERERRILLMRFFGEMTQTQIANQVGLSQMHVSRLLSRTLAHLRTDLAGEGAGV